MLMTVAMAERARVIEAHKREPELDEPTFVENLTDVLVGVLEAPVRVPALISVSSVVGFHAMAAPAGSDRVMFDARGRRASALT